MKEVDLEMLVQKAVASQKESAVAKRVEITLYIQPSIPRIQGHASLLERAFINLISNAIKFTPDQGKVAVSLVPYLGFKNNPVVEFTVADTGVGIGLDDRERIFEPFFRGKNASITHGLGLGLSIVKQIVDIHQGRILLETEPQKGSTFSVLLPIRTGGKEVT